jgi:hypothetical protein
MCEHKNTKWTPESGWVCKRCDQSVDSEGKINEIVETGQCPQITPPAEGYFSYSLGRYVKNRQHFKEVEAELTDPERNPESVNAQIPKERADYIEECTKTGEIPFVTKEYHGA